LVHLASGLSGVTPDEVAARLAAGLRGAVEFDLLHIVILDDDADSGHLSVVGRSTRPGEHVRTVESRVDGRVRVGQRLDRSRAHAAHREHELVRQYIVIAAGGHGGLTAHPGDAVVAYALPK
jgi:hypothetical protein